MENISFYILLLCVSKQMNRFSNWIRSGRSGLHSRRNRVFFSSPPRPDRILGWSIESKIYLRIQPRLRTRGVIPPFPRASSWRGA